MARLNQKSKAKAITAKENARAITLHALLITGAVLCGLLTLTQIIQ